MRMEKTWKVVRLKVVSEYALINSELLLVHDISKSTLYANLYIFDG
jgi:hypothetical protein